jgi:hypothetical protein
MELHECYALDAILFAVERTELLELKDKFKRERAKLAQQYIELDNKDVSFLSPDEIKKKYQYLGDIITRIEVAQGYVKNK